MQERSRKNKIWEKKLFLAVLASFLIHLAWLPIPVSDLWTDWAHKAPEEKQKIRVRIKNEPKQVVNFSKQRSKAAEKETDFISKEDQFFEKEQVAKKVDTYKEAGQGHRDGIENARDNQMVKAQKDQNNSEQEAKKHSDTEKRVKMSDLGVGPRSKFLEKFSARQQMKALGVESGRREQTGLAQNNDYVEDIPLGDITNLNTKEYKYYGFYHRIRQRLEQHWGNSLQEKVHQLQRSGGRFPASANMVTSLRVTMDKKGNILQVHVKSTSGLNELDEAAIESFNKAGPFPNPPRGMVKNDIIQIEWGFVVKS
jgi:protein TonB